MADKFRTSAELLAAYDNGLPGWQFNQATMDALWADSKVRSFGDACPHLANYGEGKRACLWRSRMKYDPKAFGEENQQTGDCVSHGARNGVDITRSVEIDIQGQSEDYFKRSATEPTYGARGGYGQGMDPAVATRFHVDHGFLFRKKYDFVDLTTYDSDNADKWVRGMPAAMETELRKCHVGRYVAPQSLSEAKALFAAGYACHSGQQFGVASSSDARGISRFTARWNHDMCTGGMDDTKTVYPVGVFLVMNSWGRWNSPPAVWPEDVYGPWPEGSFWVAEDLWEEYFLGSNSIFFYCDIQSVPAKKLPDYGTPSTVLG